MLQDKIMGGHAVLRRWSLVCVLVCLSTPALAQDLTTVRYGETASTWKSIFSLPVRVADKQGFFTKQGLKFEMVPIEGGGEATLDALEDGRADLAHVASSFLVTGAMKGRRTVGILAEFNNPIYSLVAKPWFKSFEDLRGRLIGMADMSGSVALSTLALFRKHGLTEKDFRTKVVEGTSPRFQCVTQADCDAVALGQPQDFYALRQGFRILGATNEAVPEFLYTVTAADRDWARRHEDVVVRYVKAMADAFVFIRAPENRDAVVAIIMEAWNSSEASATGTWDLFFRPEKNVLPLRGEISLSGFRQVIRFLQEGGVLKEPPPPIEKMIETRYLEAAGIKPDK